ncbi:dynein regulatory complex subunit 6-like isoform X1 [Anopheles cruzii]|uniref:dynein regulatory complex subunit 6-like isoform X1 n=1 Tax=Anopheles cruzii TaxID=68878 RepID=UPI0022EC3FCC|nr:dynein regulatory complex subunit 6-like isoform X1 [Anopheles cruzii]
MDFVCPVSVFLPAARPTQPQRSKSLDQPTTSEKSKEARREKDSRRHGSKSSSSSSSKKRPEPKVQERRLHRDSLFSLFPDVQWKPPRQEEPVQVEVEYCDWMAPFNCDGRFVPRYDLLPMELILKVFKMINASDRLAASATCRRWLEAAHCYDPFQRRMYFNFDRIEFSDQEGPIAYFTQSMRTLPYLSFTFVEFTKHSDFWVNNGQYIRELTLRCCLIRKKKFISIMKNLPLLERLELMQCDELFKHWSLDYSTDEPMFPFALPHLKHLSLAACDYYNEYHFERFIEAAPNLESIDVSNCFINLYLSRRMTMISRVLRLVSKNRNIMKALNIADIPCFDDVAWHCLAEIGGLFLTHFTVTYSDRIPLKDPGILKFFAAQTKLTHLDLTSSIGVNDVCLQLIVESCPLLEVLKLRRCWLLSDEGVQDIHTLRHLRVLDISSCERISDYGMRVGIVGKRARPVDEMYFSLLCNLSDYTMYYLVLMFKNLQVLDLDSNSTITDTSLQYLCCYSQDLCNLNLQSCSKLTDAGFTGIDLPEKTFSIWDVEETFAIDRLKKLRVLKVSGCYKITDFALRYAFRFTELKELSLSRCHQISEAGIERLVASCPALEYLDLGECPNINDYCVKLIAIALKRIGTLKLANCPLLTETCLDYLAKYCTTLKYLYVRGCFKLPPDIMDRLSTISSLRQVYKS